MESLRKFLQAWEPQYDRAAQAIAMFDQTRPLEWTQDQKGFFARTLYHSRGHFYKFLWHLGSRAQSKEQKEVILDNIRDEFGIGADGVSRFSHEQLYWHFADAVGVNTDAIIREEILGEKTNLPFIKEFNQGHLEWIMTKPWDYVWGAFSAYERLDNLDYENLYRLAVRLGVSGKALVFYEVHREVEHYESATPLLEAIWDRDPDAVRAGFDFIGQHQLSMWRHMNDAIAAHA
ncbi:MAG: hypothetical protein RIQ56_981 [Candidatus Parcubacteria bacterium]|jgi:hypothetical protein